VLATSRGCQGEQGWCQEQGFLELVLLLPTGLSQQPLANPGSRQTSLSLNTAFLSTTERSETTVVLTGHSVQQRHVMSGHVMRCHVMSGEPLGGKSFSRPSDHIRSEPCQHFNHPSHSLPQGGTTDRTLWLCAGSGEKGGGLHVQRAHLVTCCFVAPKEPMINLPQYHRRQSMSVQQQGREAGPDLTLHQLHTLTRWVT
jgi:hypothetical protein